MVWRLFSRQRRAAWELGSSVNIHGGDGRALTTEVPFAGGHAWSVGAGYTPCCGQSTAEWQAFYDAVVTDIGNGGRRNAFSYYLDASASVGASVHTKCRPAGGPSSLGPYGVCHVNPAGQEFHEFLQLQVLASEATFFKKRLRDRSNSNS